MNEAKRDVLNKFFENYPKPKLESHSCRKDSTKLYLQTLHRCKSDLYKEYSQFCENQNGPLSIIVFSQFMKISNFCLFTPRKDQCYTSNEFTVGTISEESYKHHREEIEKSRDEKKKDVQDTKTGQCLFLCMDVQAVKLVPQLKVSSAYYKMELEIHNFTIYNIAATHESANYFWDESEGELVASIFTTIICSHIETVINAVEVKIPVVIYSDGCSYQNRNVVYCQTH